MHRDVGIATLHNSFVRGSSGLMGATTSAYAEYGCKAGLAFEQAAWSSAGESTATELATDVDGSVARQALCGDGERRVRNL